MYNRKIITARHLMKDNSVVQIAALETLRTLILALILIIG